MSKESFSWVLGVTGAVFLFAAQPAAATGILLTTEEYPPFNMTEDGKIVGISTEAVKEIFEKAGVHYKIEMYPWERAFGMALKYKNTCAYSTNKTDERRDEFEWIGPLWIKNWVLYARADKARPLASLDEAKNAKIGGYPGDARMTYLQERGFNVVPSPDDESNIRKLLDGEIDYWPSSDLNAKFLLEKEGVTNVVPVITFGSVEVSIACNKETDKDVLAKLRDAFAEIHKTGKK